MSLRKIASAIAISLTALGAFVAPSPALASVRVAGAAQGYKIFFLPKFVGIPVFTANEEGANSAAKLLGDTLTFNGPTSASAALQEPFLTSAIREGYNAIVYDPNDPTALVPTLEQALHAGIKIVTYDSDTANPALRTIFVAPPSGTVIGSTLLQIVASQLKDKGEIAILGATPEDATSNLWIASIKATLAEPQYKGMTLVKVAYGNNDPAISAQQTEALLQAYPNLAGIISTAGNGTPALARVLSSEHKCNVAGTGLATPSTMKLYIDSGCIKAAALWNEVDFGFLPTYVANLVLEDKLSGQPGQTFTAGYLGKFTVGAHGVVTLSKLLVYNKSNIDNYHF
jgi:rhamnose transport system substrate-binding protein